jgi:dTDP-4-amino-4,6-dideoxygalactose transaminase
LKKYIKGYEKFPATDMIAKEGLYLPSGLALTLDQQNQVIKAIGQIGKI